MSEHFDQDLSSEVDPTRSKLYICLFSPEPLISQSIVKLLNGDSYWVEDLGQVENGVSFLVNHQDRVDCLVLFIQKKENSNLAQLDDLKLLLPTVIVETENLEGKLVHPKNLLKVEKKEMLYGPAEICLYLNQLNEIEAYIEIAISKFLHLAPDSKINGFESFPDRKKRLILQQRRLLKKLTKRLGSLGFYSKRKTQYFYRNLNPEEQQQIYFELSQNYRRILLEYFIDGSPINQLIDEFVDQAFFADISASQILEIHMELIDDFSHQLQIEGRSDDVLLDYRLPLIDTIAHLCEIYRSSS